MSIGHALRQNVWVRFADQKTEPVREWCYANRERNAFDERVLDYPQTKILAAENGKVIAYLPIQSVAMLESIGPNPEASVQEMAAGMIECVKAAATLAHGAGYGEMYMLISDENTAKGAEYLGFERLPYAVMRKRIR